MTHVTIAPNGRALSLPEATRAAFADAQVDRNPAVGPAGNGGGIDDTDGEDYPTFAASFPIRSPHIERSELAYFEEYPRFADVAIEEYLTERGTSLGELGGQKQPVRLRDWHWAFGSPVAFESTMEVECDVRAVTGDTVRMAQTFATDGETRIEAISDYGCFDRSGNPVEFDAATLAPFESERRD